MLDNPSATSAATDQREVTKDKTEESDREDAVGKKEAKGMTQPAQELNGGRE